MKKNMKKCSECGVVKSLNDFYKGYKGRHAGQCKVCKQKINKKWKIKNCDKVAETKAKWIEKNKEYIKGYAKAWREDHPGYFKAWREKNPDYYKKLKKRKKIEVKELTKQQIYDLKRSIIIKNKLQEVYAELKSDHVL